MVRDGKVALLARWELLRACSREELTTLARRADLIHVGPEEVLVDPRDRTAPLLAVLDGDAWCSRVDGRGQALGGSLYGAAEALAGVARTDHVAAGSAAKVLVLDQRRFAATLRDCPGLTLGLAHDFARQLTTPPELG